MFDTANMLKSDNFGILKIEGKTYYGELDGRERTSPEGLGVWIYSDGSYFKGEWRGGKRQGKGIFHRANGEEYRGDFKDDYMNGSGSYYWPNGNWYKGDVLNGALTGKGTRYSSKTRCYYSGCFENGEFIGKFVAYDENGTFYELQCDRIDNVEEKRHLPVSSKRTCQLMRLGYGTKVDIEYPSQNGYGEKKFPDGSIYRGNFLDGDMFGHGILIQKDGTKFEGEWLFGKRQGRGKLTYANGYSIDSVWNGEKYGGKTIFSWANGDKCEVVEMEDGRYKGKKIFGNGDTYIGEVREGIANGKGIYTFKNGDVYRGSMVNDKPDGRGILTCKNGEKYAGDFERGEKFGIGIYQYRNGDRFEGEFFNNEAQKDRGVFIPLGQRNVKKGRRYTKVSLVETVGASFKKVQIANTYVQFEGKEFEITIRDAVKPSEYYVELDFYKGDKQKSNEKFDGAGINIGKTTVEKFEYNGKDVYLYCSDKKIFHIYGQKGRDIKILVKRIEND